MNAAISPGPLELVVMLVISGGGFFSPAGVPPTDEDPVAANVAPAECIFYSSWAGTGTPDPASGNHTERLLADAEVSEFVSRSLDYLLAMLGGADPNAKPLLTDVRELARLVRGKPGAVFISDFLGNDQRPPTIKGGGLIRVREESDRVRHVLEKLQGRAGKGQVTAVQADGHAFSRIQLADDAPSIVWGIVGEHLFVGIGDGSLEKLLERRSGEPPSWLKDARAKLQVPRPSSVTYLDIARIVQIALDANPRPEAVRVVSILGLDNIRSFASLFGLDDTGCVTRSLLTVDGSGTGLLAWIEAKPLTHADLQFVERDAPVAVAFKLDPVQVYDLWLEFLTAVDPRVARRFENEMQQFEAATTFSLRDGFLATIGDTWRIFSQPTPNGLVTGWTVAVDIRDLAKLKIAQETLIELAEVILARGDGPTLRSEEVGGQTVHTLEINQAGIPFAPSWCVTDRELLFALTPGNLKRLLPDGESNPSIVELPDVKSQLTGDARTLAMAYIDTKEVVRMLLPLVQLAMQGMGNRPGGPPMAPDLDWVPAVDAAVPHLQPTLAVVRRTSDGIEFESHRTIPGGNIGAAAPVAVALLLPAVSSAREAARRNQSINNMRHIALAMHNFHSAHGAFPAGYSADANGKPLLSWRVHILPYLEGQMALYDQFHLDEPWDSPHNKKLIEQMPEIYRSPNSTAKPGMASYLGVGGADGIFIRPAKGGKFGTSMQRITDGTSNTISTVEVPDKSTMIWTKPGDFAPHKKDPIQGLLGTRPGGFIAGFADGSVRFISESIDPGVLKSLFTKSGGEVVDARF